jgi:glutathione synthase/RimK-type ligase-like ATP-grasp enzyme
MPRVGLLVGVEQSFPRALEERLAAIPGVGVEILKWGPAQAGQRSGCDLLLDRISHEVPYYRSRLLAEASLGVRVVNDPTRLAASDRFVDRTRLSAKGFAVPRTVLLPHKEYADTVTPASLRNLSYPLDWDAALARAGMPARLRPARAEEGGPEAVVEDVAGLVRAFDRTGRALMLLEGIEDARRSLRAFVFGGRPPLLARLDPAWGTVAEEAGLSAAEEALVARIAQGAVSATGYDLAAVDLALREEGWVVLDVVPYPDLEVATLGPRLFARVIEEIAVAVLEWMGGRPDAARAAPSGGRRRVRASASRAGRRRTGHPPEQAAGGA